MIQPYSAGGTRGRGVGGFLFFLMFLFNTLKLPRLVQYDILDLTGMLSMKTRPGAAAGTRLELSQMGSLTAHTSAAATWEWLRESGA